MLAVVGVYATGVCRVSALVLCAGLGVAFTGGAGAPFFAAMAGSALGGAAGNFFHQMAEGVVSWLGGKKFGTTSLPANHDLDALTASAIQLVFEYAKGNLPSDDPRRAVLNRLVKVPLYVIVAVMRAQDSSIVGEAEVVGTLGSAMGGQTITVATPALWQSFVAALLKQTGADQQPTALRTRARDLNQLFSLAARAVKETTRQYCRLEVLPPDSDLAGPGADPAAKQAAVFAAGLLHANLAAFANDILRATFGPEGRFFVAALFHVLNTIAANTKQPPASTKFTAAQIAQIKACLPDAVNAAIAASRALPEPTTGDQLAAASEVQRQAADLASTLQGMDAKFNAVRSVLEAFVTEQRETLARIEQTLASMGTTLATVATDTGHIPAMAKDLADVKARVVAIAAGSLSAATLKTTNNFVAAKIIPNQFFTGRTDELVRLHAALAGGSVAIVHALTGEGGIGKTELAKVYALIYADTYDSAWWLDASSAALHGELVKVYERATGKQAPQNAQADDLCQALVDHWKNTRPLVILDNVDDPANFTILSALPTARILATTRQHHKTLRGVTPFALGVLPIADAVALLRKEIAAHRADVTDADLAAIAKELDGHALAVALAGAYLANYPSYSAVEVLAKLKASKVGDVDPVADDAEHDALGLSYRRSVAASLSLSFAIPQVAAALPVLAAASFLHPTGITIEWLMAGTGWEKDRVIKAARTLATYSIIKHDKTISLHRLTQGVARSRPEVAGGAPGEAVLKRLFVDFYALHQEDDHDQVRPLRTAAAPHIEAACDATLATPSLAPTHRDAAVCHRMNAEHFQIMGDVSSADRVISKAVAWAESQGGGNERDLMAFLASRARIRQRRGDLAGAEADIQKSIDWHEAQFLRNEGTLANLYAVRAKIRGNRGDLEGAEADIQKSIAWGEAQSPRDERGLAIDYATRAGIRQDRGDLKGAEADIQKCIAWGEAQSPRDGRSLAVYYAVRAGIRQARGDLAGAEADIKWSVDWGETQSPCDERSLSVLYTTRASIRRDRGDLVGAEAEIQKSIAWELSQTRPNQRELAIRYSVRARIRRDRGDLEGAEADIQKSIDWEESQTRSNQRALAICYSTRASIRHHRGDLAGAEEDIQRSIAWGEAQYPRDEDGLAMLYTERAKIRGNRGDLAGAKADIQKSIDWNEAQSPRNEGNLAFLYGIKAVMLAAAGEFPEARAAIDASVSLLTAIFGAQHKWTTTAIRRQQVIHAGRAPG